jgi:putative FmdB family regulatory protein
VPTYQYRCEQCAIAFERTETISEHELAKPKCPKCGSKKVSVVPGRVYVVTSKKSYKSALAARVPCVVVAHDHTSQEPALCHYLLSRSNLYRSARTIRRPLLAQSGSQLSPRSTLYGMNENASQQCLLQHEIRFSAKRKHPRAYRVAQADGRTEVASTCSHRFRNVHT